MMRFAKKEDMPQVIALWQEAFADTKAEIEEFFYFCGELARICVWEEAGEIAGQLVLLPVTLMLSGCKTGGECGKQVEKEAYPTEYIYAVATKQRLRGKGIATKLLQEVIVLLKAERKVGLLVPAVASLTAFYEKRGFTKCFLEEKSVVTLPSKDYMTANMTDVSKDCDPACLAEIGADRYQELRQEAFRDCSFVDLSSQMLSYAVKSLRDRGGRCGQIAYQNKIFGVLYSKKGSITEISEITAKTTEEALAVARQLCAAEGAEVVQIRRSYLTLGVHLPKNVEANGIFNLILD